MPECQRPLLLSLPRRDHVHPKSPRSPRQQEQEPRTLFPKGVSPVGPSPHEGGTRVEPVPCLGPGSQGGLSLRFCWWR